MVVRSAGTREAALFLAKTSSENGPSTPSPSRDDTMPHGPQNASRPAIMSSVAVARAAFTMAEGRASKALARDCGAAFHLTHAAKPLDAGFFLLRALPRVVARAANEQLQLWAAPG